MNTRSSGLYLGFMKNLDLKLKERKIYCGGRGGRGLGPFFGGGRGRVFFLAAAIPNPKLTIDN